MGCRRRRSATGLEVVTRAFDVLRLRRLQCRALSMRWCGIVFLTAFHAAACKSPEVAAPVPDEFTIAFPEGTGVSADRGAGQVARSLALEGLTQVAPDGRAVGRLATDWKWIGD